MCSSWRLLRRNSNIKWLDFRLPLFYRSPPRDSVPSSPFRAELRWPSSTHTGITRPPSLLRFIRGRQHSPQMRNAQSCGWIAHTGLPSCDLHTSAPHSPYPERRWSYLRELLLVGENIRVKIMNLFCDCVFISLTDLGHRVCKFLLKCNVKCLESKHVGSEIEGPCKITPPPYPLQQSPFSPNKQQASASVRTE